MGNTATNVQRVCHSLWILSTSRTVQENETIQQANARETLEDAEKKYVFEIKRLQDAAAERLKEDQEKRLKEDKHKLEAFEKVRSNVTVELRELRRSIQQLSTDMEKPMQEIEKPTEDHIRPYTRLDDYVHETMYALLTWLAAKEGLEQISMGQLMFFLKSPHIKQRRKFVLAVERIVRSIGLSIFEKDVIADTRKLAITFDVMAKRKTQAQNKLKILREIRAHEVAEEVLATDKAEHLAQERERERASMPAWLVRVLDARAERAKLEAEGLTDLSLGGEGIAAPITSAMG